MMKHSNLLKLMIIGVLVLGLMGCSPKVDVTEQQPEQETTDSAQSEDTAAETSEEPEKLGGSIILATTTSTQDSGLLDYILPYFQEKTGTEVKVVAVGTGKAIQMGVDGEADVLLAHAKSSEEAFVAEGHGIERFDVMYNDFVIVGPKDDSNQLAELANGDVAVGFKAISENGYTFVSRGDDSGTHKKELSVWKGVGIAPEGDWYVSAGKGMGDVLQMTNEMLGYTLTDRATFLAMRDTLDLDIAIEGDESLLNQYGVIAVNPEKNDMINSEGANAFIEWLLSDETQALIGEFGKEKYGQALFTPNAK